MGVSIIKNAADMPFEASSRHIGLTQKTFLSPSEADLVNISAHGVLLERLAAKGAVRPHTHDCVEIICLIKGNVVLYNDGHWEKHSAGDVFVIGAGQVHSVINPDPENESEQISFFIPLSGFSGKNTGFEATPAEVADFDLQRGI